LFQRGETVMAMELLANFSDEVTKWRSNVSRAYRRLTG